MTWPELRRLGGAPWAADLLIVGGTATLQALTLALVRPANWPPAIVIGVLQTAPLLLRRRWPLLVLATLVAASFAQSLVHVHFAGYLIAIPAAVYSVADRSGPLRWLVLAAGLLYAAGSAVQGLVDTQDVRGVEDAFPGVVVCAAFIIGLNARTRRAYLAEVRQSVAREERASIARELHDMVTHHVSAIAVQAEMHRAVRPAGAQAAVLANIAATARTALDELTCLLGVLRGTETGTAPRKPEPGLAALDDFADRARATGLDLHLSVTGVPRPLPAALELSAYRIIQEATTNSRKHAPGARVDVDLCYAPEGLQIAVTDDGPGGTPAVDGCGLIGMRERVALFGGRLDAGPAPTGGFRVRATLPAM